MPLDRDDPAYKGQRDFTPFALRFYDPFVLQFSAGWVWHCPLDRLLENYRWHIRPNHLDVGPGTGYFLEHAGLPEGSEVDPRPEPQRPAPRRGAPGDAGRDGGRSRRAQASARQGAVRLRRDEPGAPLPARPDGPQGGGDPERRKGAQPDGLFFGSTVLGDSGNHSWAARRMLDLYNGRGSFDNRLDTEEVREILEASFEHVELDVVGSIAIFFGMGPKGPHSEEATA